MSKVGKLFSSQAPVYAAQYLSRKLKTYLDKQDHKNKLRDDQRWAGFFKDTDHIVHDLTDKVKINLYQRDILAKWIYDGFEAEEVRFMEKALKKGDTFIDAGSNIGLFSLLASVMVGDTGKVLCFEPAGGTFKKLQENIALNRFGNIKAHHMGLSNEEGTLTLNVSESGYDAWNTFASYKDDKFQKIEEVAVSTLDIQLSGIDRSKIALVKIDVEGWERYVMQGAQHFLKDYSPALMVEFSEANTFAAGYFIQEVYDILADWGYRWFRYLKGELIPEEKKLHYPYDNLIATKDLPGLIARINSK